MSGINWYATLDNKEFLAKLQQCADRVKGTSSTIKKEGTAIDSVFKKLAQAAASFGAALSVKELISSLVKVRGEFQSLETAFRVMLGNAEQANALMAQLTKTAATTPFSLTDVTSAAKQLLAYGVAADSVNETLIKLGDISAGLAIPLGDLTYLYGTTMAQGRLYTQDLNQFTNRGIPMIGELAKQFGVATGEVKKLVEEGRVGFPQVEAAINSLTGEGSKFGGLMAEQVKGINGLISNLGDAVDRMFDAIGKSNQDAIEGVLKGAINIVDNYEKVGRVLAEIVAVWGTYKAACVAAHLAMYKHTALLRTLLTVFPKLAAAQKALNAAMLSNPYVLAATALSALIVAMVNATDATKGLEKAQEEYQARIERLEEKEEEHRQSVEKLIGVAEDERLSTEERLSALEKLEGWYPTIFGKYQTEYDMLSNILTIKRQIAAQDAANSISEPKNRLKMVEDTIAKLEKKSQDYIARMKEELGDAYTGTSPWASDGLSTAERAQLEMLKNTRAELKTEVSKAEAEAYFSNLAGISNEQLAAMIKERETLLAKIAIGETSDAKRHVGRTTTGYQGVYTADELQGQLNRLEAEQSRRNEPLTTNTERLARAQRAYLEAQQAYTDFLSDSSTQMTDVDAAKRAEELKSKVKAAKAELEKWGGAIEKTTAATEAGELSVAVSVDTKEAQEALVEYQAALKALEDYRASTRVTVEADTEKASAALSNLSKEGDDAIKAEIAQYNERLEGNEAYQRRKLAIAEKYAGLITKAETPEQKTELEQQRTAAMQAARAEASETDSVLRGSFDAIVANIREQLGTLFGELTSYTAKAEDGAPLSDWQKSFNDAVASMQEAAESGLRDTLDIAPLREHLGEVESILSDTQIEPIVGEGGVTLDTSDVIEGIKAIDAELAALDGDTVDVSVTLDAGDTVEGIKAIDAELAALDGDTVVSVRAALDSSALDETDTFKIDAQVEGGVEGIGEIKDAYNELKDTVGESVVLGQVDADSELKRFEDAVAAAKAKYESLVAVAEAGELSVTVSANTKEAQEALAEYQAALKALENYRATTTVAVVADTEKIEGTSKKQVDNVDETVRAEIALYNERLEGNESYYRRRLAIAEKYAGLIAKAETPEQKTELEQQRTAAMQAARAEATEADSVLRGSFDAIVSNIKEQLSALFRAFEPYEITTGDGAAEDRQKALTLAVASIRDAAEGGLNDAFDVTLLREQLAAAEDALRNVSIEPFVGADGVVLDTENVIDGIRAIDTELATLSGDAASVSVALKDSATGGIESIENKLNGLNGDAATSTAALTDSATKGIEAVEDKLGELSDTTATVQATLDDNTASGINAIEHSLDELNGSTATSTATLTDNVTKGIESVEDKLNELDGNIAVSTAALTDSATEGIEAVEGRLNELDGRTATSATMLTDSAANGVETVESKLNELGGTAVVVQATLDDNTAKGINAVEHNLNELNGSAATSTATLTDGATEGIETVEDKLDELNRATATVQATLDDSTASGINDIEHSLDKLDGSTVAATVALTDSATKGIETVGAKLDELDGGTAAVTATLTDSAAENIRTVNEAIDELSDKRASVHVAAIADTKEAEAVLGDIAGNGDETVLAEIALYNERLGESEAYQRRRLAIAEKYAELIAKAETPEQKAEVEQQRTTAMQAARAEAAETSSVLKGSFETVANSIREQLSGLFRELSQYKASATSDADVSEWQDVFNNAVTSIQEAADNGLKSAVDVTPLREQLTAVETVLSDASIEPIMDTEGVTLDTSDAIDGIKAIDAELAALAGDTADVSVGLVDTATEGISSVERRVDELDGRVATATTTLTGNASEGIVAIKTKLDELDGSVVTTTAALADDTSDGIEAIRAKADELNGNAVTTTTTLTGNVTEDVESIRVELDELSSRSATATVALTDDASEGIDTVKAELNGLDGGVATTAAVLADDATEGVISIGAKLDELNDKAVAATAALTDDASEGVEGVEAKLNGLNGSIASPSVALTDRAAEGVTTIKAKLAELDRSVATTTVSLTDDTTEGVDAIGAKLAELGGSVATTTVSLTDDTTEGIATVKAKLDELSDATATTRATLDDSEIEGTRAVSLDVQTNGDVEGAAEIKAAYDDLADHVSKDIPVGRIETDGELKRLEDAVAAAKAKYESLVTVTEAGEDALSDLRARNRQKEIELIENSFEQRLATIKSEYDAELSELDRQQAALEDINGGVLTQGMVDELEKARSLADDIRKKALEDAINDEMASFNARVDESETYQRRRLAITERYAALIAAAEKPEQKAELEQRKTTELKAARVNEAIADIDWQSVFGKTSRLFEEQINTTLEQLREYTATDEYKALQPSERKTVTEAIDRLETMTVSGQGTLSFRALREQADRVGQAFSDVVTARNEEAAAYDELLAAQQEYAAALETGDQSRIEPAQTKVEETKTTADASTARYLSAKDNLNELSQSYGDALSDTRDGLEALASGLRQLSGSSLSSVYNGLQTFVDGLNKLQVGDGDGILSKMLGKMTSLPIGEIISIADIFSEGISPILTNIVDTLFSSVTNILDDILSLDIFKDLFSSIGNGLASLGDTLTFGLFSGLRNSNAKEVRELTETLTESNEQLTNSIDKLCEEIESEGGVTAVETAEQAIENMEQVIAQTMDILESNMSYHNHHHSNASYWGLTEEDYASLNETLADYALKYGEGAEASVVNSLEDIYGLTPEEMDYIRTWNTTMWNEMLEQGKYDMSEYWEAYADLAGEIEEIENSLKETLTQTTFDTLRDNFLDALTDMETEAEDFSEDFEDMLRTAVVNSMLSELFDDEIQAFYDSFAELFENGTDAITESDLEALNDQWDTLVDEMLEMRDYYFEALGLTDDSTSEAAQASSALTVEASQESVDEANGRLTAMTALQSQTLTQLQSMQEASTTLSNKQYTLTAEIRQALVTANGHLEDIYERLKVKGNEIVAGLEDIHNALT